jgi:hypothetical protein
MREMLKTVFHVVFWLPFLLPVVIVHFAISFLENRRKKGGEQQV